MITRTSYKMIIEDEQYRVGYSVREYRLFGIRLFKTQDEVSRRGSEISLEVRELVRRLDDYECVYCRRVEPLRDSDPPEPSFHIDHIIPQVQGGPTHLWNLAYSCRDCNLSKSGRTPSEANKPLKFGRFDPAAQGRRIPHAPEHYEQTWPARYNTPYERYIEDFENGPLFMRELRAVNYRIPHVHYVPPLAGQQWMYRACIDPTSELVLELQDKRARELFEMVSALEVHEERPITAE